MPVKKEYTESDFRVLNPWEHIRLRPAMYVGQTNFTGFLDCFKKTISLGAYLWKPANIILETNETDGFQINLAFENLQLPFGGKLMHTTNEYNDYMFGLSFQILNALSSSFEICLYPNEELSDQPIIQQIYAKGAIVSGNEMDGEINAESAIFTFTLDNTIWDKDFALHHPTLVNAIQQLSWFHPDCTFNINHGSYSNSICTPNGLLDKLYVQMYQDRGKILFPTLIRKELIGFTIQIAFAFTQHTINKPFTESFALDYKTQKGSSHETALLKGLCAGIKKYLKKHHSPESYKVTHRTIRKHLIAAANIQMRYPQFGGNSWNKLTNKEIIHPIADIVARHIFALMEKDVHTAQSIIENFEIEPDLEVGCRRRDSISAGTTGS